MLGHQKRSSTMMHATPTQGTATPVHPRPSHQSMAGAPGMDHPAGGGDMPLPQGGPGGSMAGMHEPVMPPHGAPRAPISRKSKMPAGY